MCQLMRALPQLLFDEGRPFLAHGVLPSSGSAFRPAPLRRRNHGHAGQVRKTPAVLTLVRLVGGWPQRAAGAARRRAFGQNGPGRPARPTLEQRGRHDRPREIADVRRGQDRALATGPFPRCSDGHIEWSLEARAAAGAAARLSGGGGSVNGVVPAATAAARGLRMEPVLFWSRLQIM
jgi:hypothetical protein